MPLAERFILYSKIQSFKNSIHSTLPVRLFGFDKGASPLVGLRITTVIRLPRFGEVSGLRRAKSKALAMSAGGRLLAST
jgi:hypothetical protein